MTRRAIRSPGRASGRGRLGAFVGASVLVMALVGAGCSGADSSSSSTTTTSNDPAITTGTAPPVRVFSDPTQPISIVIGEQFAIVLPAEPSAGKSWQPTERPNGLVILSIGTEFREPGDAVTGQTLPPDTVSQVLRYGGRTAGTAQISLRYGKPGPADPSDPTMVFNVTVIDPSIPTTTAPPPTDSSTTTVTPTTAPRSTTTRPRTTTTTTRKTTTTT